MTDTKTLAGRLRVGDVAWARVRIDTNVTDDGWCFCTPANPPEDVARGLMEEWEEGSQFFGQVVPADALDRITPPDAEELPFDRDTLGRMVREAWVRWAKTQPAPKPSWLVAYDDLAEPDKEADRQIGEAIAKWTMIGSAARAHSPAADRITPPDAGVELVRYGVTDYQFATPVMEPREAGPWVRYEDANAAIAAEKARADELASDMHALKSAIFGGEHYDRSLRVGNFVEMARGTEEGRRHAKANAEAADCERDEALAALAEARARIAGLEAVCRAYEQWEADVIEDDRAWMVNDGMFVPQDSYDRMIEIQAQRNAALLTPATDKGA